MARPPINPEKVYSRPDSEHRLLRDQYAELGGRFMALFVAQPGPQHELPGEIYPEAPGRPQALHRLVRVEFTDTLADKPITVKLNLEGDFLKKTSGQDAFDEGLNALIVNCWSPDPVVGVIAEPKVTAQSLKNFDRCPALLDEIEKSFEIAEAIVLERTTPDLSKLL